jgi:hypothetical protein
MNPIEFTRLMLSIWATQVVIVRKLTEAAWEQQPFRPAPAPDGVG